MTTHPLARLRTIGLIEGCSTLILFFIAMPLKYWADIPNAVTIFGSIHGGLFVLYCLAIAWMRFAIDWPWKRMMVAFIAAVVPFGPFILEPSLRREQEERTRMKSSQ